MLFQIFMLAVILGYPTNLLYELKQKSYFLNDIDKMDKLKRITFWIYISGIMKAGNDDKFEYKPIFFYILIGLVIDRLTITWMTNRFGCNYFKL